jgi:predicted transcriptional regulator
MTTTAGLKNQVYQLIRESEDGLTAAQLSRMTGASIRKVSGCITRLRREGKIERERGAWRANPSVWHVRLESTMYYSMR